MKFSNKELKDVAIFGSPLKLSALKLKRILGVGNVNTGTLDNATILEVTEDPNGTSMDFAIGKFPSWPEFDGQSNNERGFYYGNIYQNGVGIINNNSSVNVSNNGIQLRPGLNFVFSLDNTGINVGPSGLQRMVWGSGSPNGVVTARPGSVYFNTDGGTGTTFYVKESGNNTNTGWVAK